MVVLTPDAYGNTIIVMGIVYVATIGYSIYMAIIGKKQADVRDKMIELIAEAKAIRALMEDKDGNSKHKSAEAKGCSKEEKQK